MTPGPRMDAKWLDIKMVEKNGGKPLPVVAYVQCNVCSGPVFAKRETCWRHTR